MPTKGTLSVVFVLAPDISIVIRAAAWVAWLASAAIAVAVAIIGILHFQPIAIAEVELHAVLGVVDGEGYVFAFQTDLVISGLEVDNGVVTLAWLEDEEIGTFAAEEHVVARAAIDLVRTL